jgi:hypothetical protein
MTPSLLANPIVRGGVYTMAKDVLCEVSNCVYNEEGMKCGADQIFVVSHHGKEADTSRETDCKTFEPEGL